MENECEAGIISDALSERYGLSANAVLGLVRRAGIEVRHGRVTPEVLTQMAALGRTG